MSAEKPIELSVVVPAHNSGRLIESTVLRLVSRLQRRRAEIVVVENGSVDDTFSRCEKLLENWRDSSVDLYIIRSDKGMGHALRSGILASHGGSILLTADDLPFGFDDLDAADLFLAAERRLPPMVIGSKAHPDSVVQRGRLRALLTKGFSIWRRLMLGMRTGDPQGTILVNGDLARRLSPHLLEPGYLFTTELVYVAECLGIRPAEVPVRLSMTHGDHASRISLRDALSMAVGLLRIRRRHRGKWRTPSVTEP